MAEHLGLTERSYGDKERKSSERGFLDYELVSISNKLGVPLSSLFVSEEEFRTMHDIVKMMALQKELFTSLQALELFRQKASATLADYTDDLG